MAGPDAMSTILRAGQSVSDAVRQGNLAAGHRINELINILHGFSIFGKSIMY